MIFEGSVDLATVCPDLYVRRMNIKASDISISSFVFDIKRYFHILSHKTGRRRNERREEW
jgi:hypothetical protein